MDEDDGELRPLNVERFPVKLRLRARRLGLDRDETLTQVIVRAVRRECDQMEREAEGRRLQAGLR